MLRNAAVKLTLPSAGITFGQVPSARWLASRAGTGDEDIAAARQWLARFDPDTIPRNICELSFSRSSGPGGQNVNKVNSKATLRLPLESLLPLVPSLLHPGIRQSRYYASKSNSIIIQTDDSRKQQDNVHRCYVKLHQLIVEAGADAVPGETSEAQRARVKGLQRADNEARLRMKKIQSSKKTSRKSGSRPDY